MLTAAAHGKIKRVEKLELWEDEITSCIFGEIKYLKSLEVWNIFRHLAKAAKIEDSIWPKEVPDKVKFDFWPPTGPVEPDLIVHFYKNNLSLLHIIVEVKWEAGLSPKCELVRQWGHRSCDVGNWLHLYLVKNVFSGIGEIHSSLAIAKSKCADNGYSCCDEDKDTKKKVKISGIDFKPEYWEERLGCIGWRDVVEATSGIDVIHKGIRIFFKKQGIEIFSGFSQLPEEKLLGENLIFFKQ